MMRTVRHLVLTVVVSALAVAVPATAARAGSDRPTPKQWAKSVCSSIEDWITSISDTVSSLPDAQSLEDAVDTASSDIQDATEELVNSFEDLGLPQTKNAKKAEQAVDKLGKQLEQDVQDIEDLLADPGEDAVDIAATFADIGSEIQHAIGQLSNAAETLARVDRNGEIEKALRQSPACKSLRNAV